MRVSSNVLRTDLLTFTRSGKKREKMSNQQGEEGRPAQDATNIKLVTCKETQPYEDAWGGGTTVGFRAPDRL